MSVELREEVRGVFGEVADQIQSTINELLVLGGEIGREER